MGMPDKNIHTGRGVIGHICRELADRKGRVLVCGSSGDSGARFLAENGLEVLRRSEPPTDGVTPMYEAAVAIAGEEEYVALPLAFFAGLRRAVRPGGLIGIVVTGANTGNSRPDRAQLLVAFEGCSIEYARTESEDQNEWSVIFRKPTALV